MKTFLHRTTTLFLLLLISLICKAQPGTLDSSFGVNGKAFTQISSPISFSTSLVEQPDNKLISAGGVYGYESTMGFAMTRYSSDGKIDSSFGENGLVVTQLKGYYNLAYAVSLQTDGKILLAGKAQSIWDGSSAIFIRRFMKNGKIDSSFGTNGYAFIQPTGRDIANCIKVLPDDKILVAGECYRSRQSFILLRLTREGLLDSTFGTNGIVTSQYNFGGIGKSISIQSDSKILVSGYTNNSLPGFLIARYYPNGNIDRTYADNGFAFSIVNGYYGDALSQSSAVLEDDKLIVAGTTLYNAIYPCYEMKKFKVDGKLDSSFGINGRTNTIIVSPSIYSTNIGLGIQQNGKILIAGSEYSNIISTQDFKILRYWPNGMLDSAFAGSGSASTNITDYDVARALLIQKNGNIVVSGSSDSPNEISRGFSLCRYKGDEPITVSIKKDISIVEGSTGTTPAKFTVSLNKNPESTVTVNYTTKSLSAKAGSDFTTKAGKVTFGNGFVNKSVTIDVTGDNLVEPNERFALVLSNPVNAVLGTIDSAICIIKNDDPSFSLSNSIENDISTSEKSVKIYPNPVKDVLNIQGLNEKDKVQLSIVDVNGKVLVQKNVNTSLYQWNIKALPAGSYFLQIEKQNKIYTYPFIKQ